MLTRLLFVSALLFASIIGSSASSVGPVINGNFDEPNQSLQTVGLAPYGWFSGGGATVENSPANSVSSPNSVKLSQGVEATLSQPLDYTLDGSDSLTLTFKSKMIGTSTPQVFRATASWNGGEKIVLIGSGSNKDEHGFGFNTVILQRPADQPTTGQVTIEFYSRSANAYYIDNVNVAVTSA